MIYYLLGMYLLGVVSFLLFERDLVLGGWVQTLVTALVWPVLLGYILVVYVVYRREIKEEKL